MKKTTYIAVLEPVPSGYSVYFPDLPGCTSAGSDFSEATVMATEALSIFLYDLEREGEQLPTPSQPGDIEMPTPGSLMSPIVYRQDFVRRDMLMRSVKVNVTIPEWMKLRAETMDVNYSRLLQGALMVCSVHHQEWSRCSVVSGTIVVNVTIGCADCFHNGQKRTAHQTPCAAWMERHIDMVA
jgi:predicted RNase H-like HicB family nuclease